MIEDKVILVDLNNNQVGLMPKLEAHEKGVLHRAFSVFVFNENGELMLQRRSLVKYHSPGLWTNTCCSHQREGESNIESGKRRLNEEMGFTTELTEKTSFIYKAEFDNGLIEHEFDHILVGYFDNSPKINTKEVDSWKWMSMESVQDDINESPENYTAWFKIIFKKYYKFISQ
jgi:isopentenyl-diphosphate delta-isomerase